MKRPSVHPHKENNHDPHLYQKNKLRENLTSDNKKCACFYSDEDIFERACRVNLFHGGFGKGFILFGILSLERRSQQSPQIRSD